ncbi:MAG TPA: TIM-barrel domain-containing protein [Arachnia sp.]|nr:TIM-barrel domain-containing protein [Arachnia sp.]
MFAMSDGQPAPAHPDAVVAGPTYRITVLTSRLLRFEWHPEGRFVDERTQTVVNRSFEVPEFTADAVGGELEVRTEHLRLRYDGGPFSGSGLSVTLTRGSSDPHYSTWRFGESYPQNLPGRGNLLGTARTLDEVDGACPLEPGILATYGFAVLDDSTSVLLSPDGWVAGREGGGRDLYLFAHGRDYRGALSDYHRLTGPVPLVPRFVLGNWWSRYWPYRADEYLAVMDRFRSERIPLSVGVIDMDWHVVDVDPELGTGWTGYTWNRELFPDPQAFLAALHERGLAVTLNVHPADGVRRHEEAYPSVARAVGIDPATGAAVEFDVTSREFVDAYLAHLHHPLEDQGVDFWWIDWQSGGATALAGLDPLWMLNHIHYHDSGRGGRRPLTFSRYSGPGSHRYPVGFSGDTITTWDSLDFQPYFTATAANIGYPWWSHDIGGHMFGSRDVEMAVRWFQLGVFSPINRLHSSSSPFASKEPWGYGPEAERIMAAFLRLRHRLVPYLYTAAWAAHAEQVALVRPMYHDHPDVAAAYQVPNQSMVGEHLLVAPITAAEDGASHLASTRAWLPEGSWTDLFTGHRHDGGRTVVLHRGLGGYPVLARAGAVIALSADPMADVTESPRALDLRVMPGTAVSHLVEDDGSAAPGPEARRQVRMEQVLEAHPDRTATLTVTLRPGHGAAADPRTVALDVVGVESVELVEVWVAGTLHHVDHPSRITDELLAPALRVWLGEVDLGSVVSVRLGGARRAPRDVAGDAFALIDAAEIEFTAKEAAWRAVTGLSGWAMVQELATVDIPGSLRDALVEVAAAGEVW